MERAAAQARYDKLHEEFPYHDGTFTRWGRDRSEDHPYHASEGVTIYVAATDEHPDDHFLTPPDDVDDDPDGERDEVEDDPADEPAPAEQ